MTTSLEVDLDRAIDIKLEVHQPTRLIAEIISHTTWTCSLVITFLIKDTVIIMGRIFHLEVTVLETDEYHRLPIHLIFFKGKGFRQSIILATRLPLKMRTGITLRPGCTHSQAQHHPYQ